VSRAGSIDWLCWPRFDSPACFASILGGPEHGYWRVAPECAAQVTRRYLENGLVLETRFRTSEGTVALTDFMALGEGGGSILRILRGEEGRVPMRFDLLPRFDYGMVVPRLRQLALGGAWRAVAGPDAMILRTKIPVHARDGGLLSEFDIAAGESVAFVLSHVRSHAVMPPAIDPEAALAAAGRWGRGWLGGTKEDLPPVIRRSLLTLKALIHAPTGAMVAAPTTSLPEQPGGTRNWDYRYCWLRDTAWAMQTLLHAGITAEPRAWITWLRRTLAGRPEDIGVLYGLGGERRVPEWEADWLPGYNGASPVRIGNEAAGQLQLDVAGEVIDMLYQARCHGIPLEAGEWSMQRRIVDHLDSIWTEPDEGIWEVRGGRRHFTFSKIMAWVAFDRAIRSAEQFSLSAPLERWRETRARIHDLVCEHGFDAAQNAFTQSFNTPHLDASLLLLPSLGFLPAHDPRVAGTIAAIERGLMVDGLVQRYDTRSGRDGLPPGEGTFLACSFWLVEAMAQVGRVEEAERMFDRLLGLANDLGLLAEEYDPLTGCQLGNFPQAMTHTALVQAALTLAGTRVPVA
jgi:GH15 family glucan-1,4-alpha-glucosidase